MFCPKCGKADQSSETFCRQCGVFLPNLAKLFKTETPPADHLKSNTVLAVMTILASFTMAALLYIFLRSGLEAHPVIYASLGIFIAIGAWHVQTLIRTRKLKNQFERQVPLAGPPTINVVEARPTGKMLDPADLQDVVPASVTENTTRNLQETYQRPQSKR